MQPEPWLRALITNNTCFVLEGHTAVVTDRALCQPYMCLDIERDALNPVILIIHWPFFAWS
jgi:hypothetical protein